MNVLGILGRPVSPLTRDAGSAGAFDWYHNSSAVLLQNGRVTADVEEERLNRRKHSGEFPMLATNFCLSQAGLRLDELMLLPLENKGVTAF